MNGKTAHDYQSLQFEITELSDYITKRKKNNPATNVKTYWTFLKTFYSGKKTPLIPQLVINDQLITDFREKVNFFILNFAKQCKLIENDNSIPPETN